jgi:hypothetical protein
MKIFRFKKLLFGISLLFISSLTVIGQPILQEFSTITKNGTILIYAHQDDDLIWMLPWWQKSEKFIEGSHPTTWHRRQDLIPQQQAFLDNGGYNVEYQDNWIAPWPDITPEEYDAYYNNVNHAYDYIGLDHIEPRLYSNEEPVSRNDINKIKAKIEPYIADPAVERIISHNCWGEYGHQHHRALNIAVRELAIKYRKDLWMLASNGNIIDGNFEDITIPDGITYTMASFDSAMFAGIRTIYRANNLWTWYDDVTPSGPHAFIKEVEAGVDRSSVWPDAVPIDATSYPLPLLSGAYMFDGNDDYLTFKGNNNPQFTIAMRVNPDQIRSMDISGMSEYPGSSTFDRSFFMESDGRVSARIYDGSTRTVTSSSSIPQGNWTHLVMTGNGTSLKLYINGTLISNLSTGTARTTYTTPEFVIGRAQETASNFSGQITDVHLFDYELSASDISYLNGTSNPQQDTIFVTQTLHGAITPSGNVIVLHGGDRTFTIAPAVGYQITDVLVDGSSVGAVSSYTFTSVSANHTITATYSALSSIALNKTATAQSSEGTYPPSNAVDSDPTYATMWSSNGALPQWWSVDLGEVYDVTGIIVRNFVDGYRVYQYTVEGSIDGVTYTQIASKTNNNVSVADGDQYHVSTTARYLRVTTTLNNTGGGGHIFDFRAYGTVNTNYHAITATTGTGGTVTPAGDVVLINGASQAYTITPGLGYYINDVLVDGVSIGAVSSYTFTNVVANHTISATFSQSTSIALNKTATAQSFEYVGVGPSQAVDSDGSNNSYWAGNPSPQWWQVDLGGVYDITGVIIRNYVDFGRYYQYNIESSIDGINYTRIAEKTNTNLAAEEGDGYPLTSVTTRYLRVNMTLNSVGTGVHISDFRVFGTPNNSFLKITATTGEGGTISPAGDMYLASGANQTYTITPLMGNRAGTVTVDGVPVGVVSSYTFSNVTTNHTIHAVFTPNPSLALNKPSTALSSEFGYGPELGNDALATNESRWASLGTNPQWWRVDLGERYDLKGIVVRNYFDGWRYYHYTIETSDDDVTYTQVASKTDDNAASNEGESFTVDVTARYVRVNITYNAAGPGAHITDVRVFGNYRITATPGTGGTISPSPAASVPYGGSQTFTIAPGVGYTLADVRVDNVSVGAVSTYTFNNVTANHTITATFNALPSIALNKPATAQSNEISRDASKANDSDGTNASYWGAYPYPQWWQVDLGDTYDLSGIIIRPYVRDNRYYNYNIEASTDGVTFTQIISKTSTTPAVDAGDAYPLATTARYLRVNMTYNSVNLGVHIADFKAFGTINSGVPKPYNITASAGTGGSVTPSGMLAYAEGSNQTYTITPNSFYSIADVLVDGVSAGAVSSYTFNNILGDHTISATFTAYTNLALNKPATSQSSETGHEAQYANDADGTNGSSWSAHPFPQWWQVDLGANYDISAIVLRNYVDNIRYYRYSISGSTDGVNFTTIATKDNSNPATDAGDTYSLSTTARYLRVDVTYSSANTGVHITDFRVYGTLNTIIPKVNAITSSAGANGSITPLGTVSVADGGSQAYTITPATYFQVADVLVDGVSVGAVSSYTFTNVTANHTISATFSSLPNIALNKPAISKSADGVNVASRANDSNGTNGSFWAAYPYPQWWSVDLGNNYDISAIIIRNYVWNSRYYQYTIEGSIDGVTYTQIASKTNTNPATDAGDAYNVTVTARYLRVNLTYNSANNGVHISDFRVYGTLNTIIPKVNAITATTGTGGTITPSGTVSVADGGSQAYTITPASYYQISDVLVDGVSVGAVSGYTFSNVTANHTISATFSALPNIALNKTATSQSVDGANVASRANDSNGTNASFWAAYPYSRWWMVDLGDNYDVTDIVIRNYVWNARYYLYNIEASLDGITFTRIAEKTNTNPATEAGDPYSVSVTARYLRVNMTYNSANNGVHISDFRVYGTLSQSGSKGVATLFTKDETVTKETFTSEQENREIKLTVYPNPFRDEFKVWIDAPEDELFNMSVIDVNGRKLYSSVKVPGNTEVTFDKPLDPGRYLLVIENKTKRFVKNIVKL